MSCLKNPHLGGNPLDYDYGVINNVNEKIALFVNGKGPESCRVICSNDDTDTIENCRNGYFGYNYLDVEPSLIFSDCSVFYLVNKWIKEEVVLEETKLRPIEEGEEMRIQGMIEDALYEIDNQPYWSDI
ncbi:unnamed protein product [Ambrosiozyma monospora]|uniref:Unnamed protein product n=1 Tax=Ambrosiozyma monospora TaxID=43982 RepID=A0ACB5TAE7_AMBMO|nr:unnamed protein product [Ambrosiozyma monospora]